MAQDKTFSLPVQLRRCLVDRVSGKLSLEGQDGSTVVIRTDGIHIVHVEAPSLEGNAEGTADEKIRAILGPLFGLPDLRATFERGAHGGGELRLLVADALLEGIKRTKDTSRVSQWLGSRDEVLQLVPNPF